MTLGFVYISLWDKLQFTNNPYNLNKVFSGFFDMLLSKKVNSSGQKIISQFVNTSSILPNKKEPRILINNTVLVLKKMA